MPRSHNPRRRPEPSRSLSARLQQWFDGLPPFWQPVGLGAGLILVLMAARGGMFLWPLALVWALFSSEPARNVELVVGIPLAAVAAGAVSGLAYTLVGRRAARLPLVGPLIAGILTVPPYMVFLVALLRMDAHQRILELTLRNSERFTFLVSTVLFGSLVGYAFLRPASARDVDRAPAA